MVSPSTERDFPAALATSDSCFVAEGFRTACRGPAATGDPMNKVVDGKRIFLSDSLPMSGAAHCDNPLWIGAMT